MSGGLPHAVLVPEFAAQVLLLFILKPSNLCAFLDRLAVFCYEAQAHLKVDHALCMPCALCRACALPLISYWDSPGASLLASLPDGPGHLSITGEPRHDNDHTDIKQVRL